MVAEITKPANRVNCEVLFEDDDLIDVVGDQYLTPIIESDQLKVTESQGPTVITGGDDAETESSAKRARKSNG